jgi:hypothetical protein
MINWLGGRAKRINVVVRTSDKLVKTESGAIFNDKRYTRSVKKYTADILGSWKGKALNVEIKNKYTGDKMRPGQLEEKRKAEAVGEIYWVITCAEDLLCEIDSFKLPLNNVI